MVHDQVSIPPNELSTCRLAKQHLYEPGTNDLVDQMIRQQVLTHADLTNHPRGWNLGSTLSEYFYHPFASLPKSDKKAYTLGTLMVEKDLGWGGHTVEYVPHPLSGGVCILNNHSFCIKERTKYKICMGLFISLSVNMKYPLLYYSHY
jgi:hypothetical protein